jgi:hypothetical protein
MFPQRPLGSDQDETRIKGSTNTEVEIQTKNFTKLRTFIIHAKGCKQKLWLDQSWVLTKTITASGPHFRTPTPKDRKLCNGTTIIRILCKTSFLSTHNLACIFTPVLVHTLFNVRCRTSLFARNGYLISCITSLFPVCCATLFFCIGNRSNGGM